MTLTLKDLQRGDVVTVAPGVEYIVLGGDIRFTAKTVSYLGTLVACKAYPECVGLTRRNTHRLTTDLPIARP